MYARHALHRNSPAVLSYKGARDPLKMMTSPTLQLGCEWQAPAQPGFLDPKRMLLAPLAASVPPPPQKVDKTLVMYLIFRCSHEVQYSSVACDMLEKCGQEWPGRCQCTDDVFRVIVLPRALTCTSTSGTVQCTVR